MAKWHEVDPWTACDPWSGEKDRSEEPFASCRLRDAFTSIRGAGLRRGEAEYLRRVAVETFCGGKNKAMDFDSDGTDGGNLCVRRERLLSKARGTLGETVGIKDLQMILKQGGHGDLSNRVCNLNRARRSQAHPDVALESEVLGALASSSILESQTAVQSDGGILKKLIDIETVLATMHCETQSQIKDLTFAICKSPVQLCPTDLSAKTAVIDPPDYRSLPQDADVPRTDWRSLPSEAWRKLYQDFAVQHSEDMSIVSNAEKKKVSDAEALARISTKVDVFLQKWENN